MTENFIFAGFLIRFVVIWSAAAAGLVQVDAFTDSVISLAFLVFVYIYIYIIFVFVLIFTNAVAVILLLISLHFTVSQF